MRLCAELTVQDFAIVEQVLGSERSAHPSLWKSASVETDFQVSGDTLESVTQSSLVHEWISQEGVINENANKK